MGITVPAQFLSAGKALLAELPAERFQQLYPAPELPSATRRSLTTRQALDLDLETVRRLGYATNFGESEEEIGSIGVAVRDAAGRARAGIAVSAPLSRLNQSHTDKVRRRGRGRRSPPGGSGSQRQPDLSLRGRRRVRRSPAGRRELPVGHAARPPHAFGPRTVAPADKR